MTAMVSPIVRTFGIYLPPDVYSIGRGRIKADPAIAEFMRKPECGTGNELAEKAQALVSYGSINS